MCAYELPSPQAGHIEIEEHVFGICKLHQVGCTHMQAGSDPERGEGSSRLRNFRFDCSPETSPFIATSRSKRVQKFDVLLLLFTCAVKITLTPLHS